MTRRRLLALAFFTTPLVGVAVACSFPEVSFAPTANDPSQPDGSSSDANDLEETSAREDVTIVAPSDAAKVDLTRCQECDCDHDGYWRDAGCDASATDAANIKGFGDCDDSLVDYHPDQPGRFYTALPEGATLGFDFDCSGQEESGFPAPLACQFSGLRSCGPAGEGLRFATPCGQMGEVVTCTVQNVGFLDDRCVQTSFNPTKNAQQGCH